MYRLMRKCSKFTLQYIRSSTQVRHDRLLPDKHSNQVSQNIFTLLSDADEPEAISNTNRLLEAIMLDEGTAYLYIYK